METPLVGSPLTLRYLGQYAHTFDAPSEKPIPTWTSTTWLLEDYGLVWTKEVPADIQYQRFSRRWSHDPPMSVASHPQFCSCPRRGRWNLVATLGNVEYNWPLIQGP